MEAEGVSLELCVASAPLCCDLASVSFTEVNTICNVVCGDAGDMAAMWVAEGGEGRFIVD